MSQELSELPPTPELLKVRWVCRICLKVLREPLKISWVWAPAKALWQKEGRWEPVSVEGPNCHGSPMLVLGEAKVDVHGLHKRNLVIDPLDDMRCPRLEIA